MSYLKNYFSINIKILKLALLWYPEKKYSNWHFLKILATFIAALIMIYFVITEFVSLSELTDDIKPFINNFGIILSHVIGFIKICNFCYYRKKIVRIMQTLQSDELKCEITEDFHPDKIIQRVKTENVLFTTIFMCLIMFILAFNYATALFYLFFDDEMFYSNDKNGNPTFCKVLPFYSWIPFDHSTKTTCAFAMIYQFLILFLVAVIIVGCDTILIAMINFATGHFFVLAEGFRTIPIRCMKRKEDQPELDLDKEMKEEMKKTICYLHVILR